MTAHCPHRWFQLSLKSLFLLTLVVAAFFAGYSLAIRQAEQERQRAAQDAQQAIEEARAQSTDLLKEAQMAEAIAREMAALARQQAATSPSPLPAGHQ
jgi:predicted negative regulator of RcsB-dependent stress response